MKHIYPATSLRLLLTLIATTTLSLAQTEAQKQEAIQLREQRDAKWREAKKLTDEGNELDRQYKELARIAVGNPIKTPDATDTFAKDFLSAVKNRLQLRQSVTDSKLNALPALLQYTMPGNGSDSYQVDAGLAYSGALNFLSIPSEGRIYTEYHYNDALQSLRDTFLAGADVDLILSPGKNDEEILQDVRDGNLIPAQVIRAGMAFKSDNLVAGEGLQAYLTWIPDLPPLFGGYWQELGWISGRLEPTLGFQFESGNGAPRFPSGERLSFRAGLALEGYLFPHVMGNRLQYNAGLEYWNHINTTGLFDGYDRNQTYFVGSLTYWFNTDTDGDNKLGDDERHFGITAKYVKGDNPTIGDFDADVLTLGLSLYF